jgi:hypothetical protein
MRLLSNRASCALAVFLVAGCGDWRGARDQAPWGDMPGVSEAERDCTELDADACLECCADRDGWFAVPGCSAACSDGDGSGSGSGGAGATTGTGSGAGSSGAGSSGAGSSGAGSTGSGSSGGNSGDLAQLCVDTINDYRATLGLSPYQRWSAAESCSDDEAESDSQTQAPHGAFGQCGEWAQNECPGWPGDPAEVIVECLAAMWSEGPGGGHYEAMRSEEYGSVACGFAVTGGGDVWSVQNFK